MMRPAAGQLLVQSATPVTYTAPRRVEVSLILGGAVDVFQNGTDAANQLLAGVAGWSSQGVGTGIMLAPGDTLTIQGTGPVSVYGLPESDRNAS